jgi:pimeloyl-ACP methyl ester carboxylesterase
VTRLLARNVARPWGRMRVWRGGEGARLLAVHGLGGSGRYFQGLATRLEDRFEIVAPDLAGFGASDKPDDETYDRAFHLANLDAALDGVETPVTVVGHSIGGVFAALSAARHAGRVRALALISTPFPDGDGAYGWMREGRPPTKHAMTARAFRALVPALSLPVGVARGYPPAVAFDYGRQKLRSRARTMWWALHDPAVMDELGTVREALATTPVFLMHANDDRTVPFAAMSRWSDVFPHAEQRAIETGGHQFLIRTGADALVEWLDATLRR